MSHTADKATKPENNPTIDLRTPHAELDPPQGLCETLGIAPTLAPGATINPFIPQPHTLDPDAKTPPPSAPHNHPKAPHDEAFAPTIAPDTEDLQAEHSTSKSATDPADTPSWRYPHDPQQLPRFSLDNSIPDDHTPEYTVLDTLGKGGMGIVQLAKQQFLEREIALKRIKPGKNDAVTTYALLREAVFTGHLEHPNIVPIHALGQDEHGLPILVMKRIEGVSWKEIIYNDEHPHWTHVREGRIEYHLHIFSQICNAVHFAHSNDIIHRDIKPENVMIGEFGEVYLLDWGISIRCDEPNTGPPGQVAGSPSYMAPEMLSESIAPISKATDIYLLGATLHEAITKTPRHTGEGLNQILASALLSEPYEYPSSIPQELAQICNTATHPDPSQRFTSVQALTDAISDCLQHRASIALSQSANKRFQELRELLVSSEEPDPLDVQRLFFECRFGYEQALQSWPHNPSAYKNLQDCIALMCSFALDKKHFLFAASLLDSLDQHNPSLQLRLQLLEAELQNERDAAKKLQKLEHDLDLNVSRRQRTLFFASGTIFIFLLLSTVFLLEKLGYKIISTNFGVVIPAIVGALFFALAFIGRKTLFKNRINRNIFYAVFLTVVSIVMHRIVGLALNIPFNHIIVSDFVVIFSISCLAGPLIHRHFFILAACAFVSTIYGILRPHNALQGMLFVFLGIMAAGTHLLLKRRKKQRQQRNTPNP